MIYLIMNIYHLLRSVDSVTHIQNVPGYGLYIFCIYCIKEERLKLENEGLKQQLHSLQLELDTIKSEVIASTEDKQELQTNYKEVEDHAKDLSLKLQDMQHEYIEVQRSLDVLDIHEDKIQNMEQENQLLKRHTNELSKEYELMMGRNSLFEERNQSLMAQLNEKDNIIETLNAIKEDRERLINRINTDLEQANYTIFRKNEEIQDLRDQLGIKNEMSEPDGGYELNQTVRFQSIKDLNKTNEMFDDLDLNDVSSVTRMYRGESNVSMMAKIVQRSSSGHLNGLGLGGIDMIDPYVPSKIDEEMDRLNALLQDNDHQGIMQMVQSLLREIYSMRQDMTEPEIVYEDTKEQDMDDEKLRERGGDKLSDNNSEDLNDIIDELEKTQKVWEEYDETEDKLIALENERNSLRQIYERLQTEKRKIMAKNNESHTMISKEEEKNNALQNKLNEQYEMIEHLKALSKYDKNIKNQLAEDLENVQKELSKKDRQIVKMRQKLRTLANAKVKNGTIVDLVTVWWQLIGTLDH